MRQAHRPGASRGNQQPRAGNNKPWGKHSLAAVARNAALPSLQEVGRSGLPDAPGPSSPVLLHRWQAGCHIQKISNQTPGSQGRKVHASSRPPEGTIALLEKGPLAVQVEKWRTCAVNTWVMLSVSRGYRLQFATKPPRFNGVLMSVAEGEAAQVLQNEIDSLLLKRAIRVVPIEESQQGFYSRYFLIPKKGGSLCPILDLRVLNSHLRKYTFRMLTVKVLCQSIRPGDWFVTIDLADAYFHIEIYPAHRKFLRFAHRGIAYEYRVLPFGLLLAPRVFSKCVEAALSPLKSRGIRIFSYINDYLICSHSLEQALRDAETVTSHLSGLGFRINWTKSRVLPVQCISYLGLYIDSLRYRATLSEERLQSFNQCLARFQPGTAVPFRLCLRLLGLMASVISVVRLGLLLMREVQR